jgi:MHS family proline/betaine transporter-like MFS transporter
MVSGNTRRIIAAGVIGNVLEWYDFAIYGYFAATIGRTFFPREEPVAQVLAAFGIFALGYVMRAVGGAVTGEIGDRFGRRAALTFSVTAMAAATFLLGILPGYETLGILAPILLTLLRMVQGLSVGGECPSAIIFMVEHAPPGRRGIVGAVTSGSTTVGLLLGSATGAALSAVMSAEALQDWGWRIPFLMGLLVGVVGYFLRRDIHETPAKAARGRSPLAETLRDHGPLVLRLAGLTLFNSVGFYLMFLYVVSWLQFVDGIAPARALGINTVAMVAMLPVMLAAGWLSDRIGRKPVMLAGTALGLVGAVPLLWLMHHPDPALILVGQMGFVVAVGLSVGAQAAALVEVTPFAVRCTAISVGFNVSYGILGGLMPLAATWLVQRTDNDLSPAFLIMAAAAGSVLTVLFYKESYRNEVRTV